MKIHIYTLTLLFFCFGLLKAQDNQIVAYKYWFDDDYQGKIIENVSPSSYLNLTVGLPTQGLEPGMKILNMRFQDSEGNWSVIESTMFLKGGQIQSYEYWFDNNFDERFSVDVSPSSILNLNTTISADHIPPGMHYLNIRFKDQANLWSPVQSYLFLKSGYTVSYEYWFNNNFDERVSVDVSSAQILNLSESIPTDELAFGMHKLNYRFKDGNDLWSPVQYHLFWKKGTGFTAYEYWFDDDYENRETGEMSGESSEEWIKTFALENNNIGFDYIHVRFQDNIGLWSNIITLKTLPPVADFFVLQNKDYITLNNISWLSTSYNWSFGDGNESTQVNPSHSFESPGEYNVCLIAVNNAGSDTLCKNVTVRGISSAMPKKGGNAGFVTLTVIGGGLTENTTVSLNRNSSAEIKSDTVFLTEPGNLRARFNLSGKETGLWDIVIDIPEDTTYVLPNEFTIEEAVPVEFWAEVSGRDAVLINRWQTYTVNYGNLGNNDLFAAPLWLLVSDIEGLEIEFVSKKIDLPIDIDDDWIAIRDSIEPWFSIDSLGSEPFKARVYPLFIPLVGANETGSFTFRVKSPENFKITSWVNQDWFSEDGKSSTYAGCVTWAVSTIIGNKIAGILADQIPGASCITSVTANITQYDYTDASISSAVYTISRSILDCLKDAGSTIPWVKAASIAYEIYALSSDMYQLYDAVDDCKKKHKRNNHKDKSVNTVFSFDPNEIVGPNGYTEMNYNFDNIPYSYQIYFENMDDATAPAQEVFIYDTLDLSKYDISTFFFGNISFGDTVIYVEPGFQEFTVDIDLRPGKDIILRINGVMDTVIGAVRWAFISFDPETMDLTEDPFGGFLPPNVNSPEGEGYVSFTANLKEGLEHGTVVENKANIIFDLNPPILTNTWVNSIDREPPVSSVNPLPAESNDTSFMVSWSGTDNNSGIVSYSVYYSKNNGEPVLWKYNTYHLTDIFVGEVGSTYRFYSLATDSIGNEEEFIVYEATTTLIAFIEGLNKTDNIFTVYPNPAENILNILYKTNDNSFVKFKIYDVFGSMIMKSDVIEPLMETEQIFQFDVSRLEGGTYFCILESDDFKMARKIIINRKK